MDQVDGVKYVLGLESVIGSRVPREVLPDSIKDILESDRWELLLINSEYAPASDEVNDQITSLNTILKSYDKGGMIIGEAPCMKDMIETTDHDFAVVNGGFHSGHLHHHPAGGKEPDLAGGPHCRH